MGSVTVVTGAGTLSVAGGGAPTVAVTPRRLAVAAAVGSVGIATVGAGADRVGTVKADHGPRGPWGGIIVGGVCAGWTAVGVGVDIGAAADDGLPCARRPRLRTAAGRVMRPESLLVDSVPLAEPAIAGAVTCTACRAVTTPAVAKPPATTRPAALAAVTYEWLPRSHLDDQNPTTAIPRTLRSRDRARCKSIVTAGTVVPINVAISAYERPSRSR